MTAFDSARLAANELRADLSPDLHGYALAVAACVHLDVALRRVTPTFPALNGADATINVQSRWALLRDDVSDDLAAFLVAHELGHLRLHPYTRGTVEVRLADVEPYGPFERRELQANVFAREFLLPRVEARRRFLEQHESARVLAISLGLPLELVRLQLYDALLLPRPSTPTRAYSLPEKPTDAQQPAVSSDEPVTLVEAGPGTGKTTTLLLRLRRLLAEGARPESVVVLTFSNKAARELLERARAGRVAGADRVWIGTFHAFGLELLRKFHEAANLEARFPVLDRMASITLLESLLPALQLEAFDPLSNPYPWLEEIFDTIRRAKDELFDARQFECASRDAKQRDVARIFGVYERVLGDRSCVDFADLLCKSITLMRAKSSAVDAYLRTLEHVMVDEYQDVNRASALFVKELSRHAKTLWIVGDANQAIYAFMGASSRNIEGFRNDFPGARVLPLELNHRSSQEIVDLFTGVARANPAGRPVVNLRAGRGRSGHGPRVCVANDFDEQMDALAQRIRELEGSGIPFAERAVLTYRNSAAAEVARQLEARGIPVLFIGNIFERPEIKDLICLLQLAIDDAGVNLVRAWAYPPLRLTPGAADTIIAAARTRSCPWHEVRPEGLSTADEAAFSQLRHLREAIQEDTRPWDALSAILLEEGSILRELAARQGLAAANSLMSIWQFVHCSRSSDGGTQPGIRRLTQDIRDRIRLNEDRALRVLPPEAEDAGAVRIHTAHGSKGLEFDAVHLVKATRQIFESPASSANPLLPEAVLSPEYAEAALRNERHNLLYVSISRPRLHLIVYHLRDDELPSALASRLIEQRGTPAPHMLIPAPHVTPAQQQKTVPLESYLDFVKCPRRHHLAARTRATVDDELKPSGIINKIVSRLLQALLRGEVAFDATPSAMQDLLGTFGVADEVLAAAIEQRVTARLRHAQRLLQEGGQRGTRHTLKLGPLNVELHPEQAFPEGDVTRLRLIRNRTFSSMDNSLRQPLAALLDSHHRNGGSRYSIEFVSLFDGESRGVGVVQAQTREKYAELAHRMIAGDSSRAPENERQCHSCPYLFPCTGFSGHPD